MSYSDWLRVFLLSPAISICDTSTLFSYFFEQLFSRTRFTIFVILILISMLFFIYTIYTKEIKTPTNQLNYTIAAVLFLAALSMKIFISVFGKQFQKFDEKLYNTLKGLKISTKTNYLTSAFVFIIETLKGQEELSDCEHNKIVKPDALSQSLYQNVNLISNLSLSGNNIENPHIAELIDVKNDLQSSNINKEQPVTALNTKLDSENIKNTNSSLNDKKNTKPNSNVMLKYKLNNPDSYNEIDDFEDRFFKNVLNTLNFEFTANTMISSRIKEIDNLINKTEHAMIRLDSNIKKLLNLSIPIEREMKSFNVQITNYEDILTEMNSNLKKMLLLKTIQANINAGANPNKNIYNIFSSNEKKLSEKKTESKNMIEPLVLVAQVFLVFLFVFFLFFFYFSLIGSNIYIFKLISCILLFCGILLGFVFMIAANFYDKDCILGNIPGCVSPYSSNFTEFAKSTKLELKPKSESKADALRSMLDKLEIRTSAVTSNLKTFFEDDYIANFAQHFIIFNNLINKLQFVQDDFKELTHSKVDTKQFYGLVDSINTELAQIALNLKYIDRRFLFEFYTREIIFNNFLVKEKENIINLVEKKVESSNKKLIKQQKAECGKSLARFCDQKTALDFVSLILIFGSVIAGFSFFLS